MPHSAHSRPFKTKSVHVTPLLKTLQWPLLSQIWLLPVSPMWPAPGGLSGLIPCHAWFAWVTLVSSLSLKPAKHAPTSAVFKYCSFSGVLFFPPLCTQTSLSSGLCSTSPCPTTACKTASPPHAPARWELSLCLILLSSRALVPIWQIHLSSFCLPCTFPHTPAAKYKLHKSRNFVLLLYPQNLEECLTHKIFDDRMNK